MQEFARNLGNVPVFPIHGIIHLSHFRVGNLSTQFFNSGTHFRKTRERILANDGHCFVWRKLMFVIIENHQIARREQSVG